MDVTDWREREQLHEHISMLMAEVARLRLTDAEREAVKWFACYGVDRPLGHATTLRGLLERMSQRA